jgi:hypothetical protein
MDDNTYKQVTEEYQNICNQKGEFAKEYIKEQSINCKQCREEECTFIEPPFYCNIAMVEINEFLPTSITKLNEPNKIIEQVLDEAGI